MAKKKKRKKAASKTGKVTVSRTALNKVISLGAAHHSALAQLRKAAAKAPKARRKASKKRRTLR